jgi:uncharacterized RDD family membrane protein YckC
VTGGTSAGFGRRFAALVYDALLIFALLLIYTLAAVLIHGGGFTPDAPGIGWYLFCAGEIALIGAYYVINWVHSGQTLGMRAWRLRAVDESGKPLKVGRAVHRFLCGILAWGPAGLGVLWLYLDPEHLAIHDRLSRTRVVYLTGPRDRDQRAKSDDRGRPPTDQSGVESEQLPAILHGARDQEEHDA